jgi:hypothetical protein
MAFVIGFSLAIVWAVSLAIMWVTMLPAQIDRQLNPLWLFPLR